MLQHNSNERRFLSTPSARRATALCELDAALNKISIHALCEEGDIAARMLLSMRL